jgi:hypothetical protein
MNSIVFMPQVMPRIGGGCGNCEDLPTVLLVFTIVGAIVVMFGILGNILHVKFSQGFDTSICWDNIKPTIDNTVFGAVCGTLGFASIGAATIMGLFAGVYWFIITL